MGTTDEKIAELRRREVHIAVERGEYTNWKMFFKDAVKKSTKLLLAGKSPRTREVYSDIFRVHLNPWFGKARISEIQSSDLLEYKRAREAKGVAEESLKKEIWLTRWLLKQYGRDVEGPKEAYLYPHKPVDRFMVETEVLAITDHIRRVDVKACVLVAAYSGLRRSDILALEWSAVDFNEGFIKILQEKTERWVKVPIHEKLIGALNMIPRGLGNSLVFPRVTEGSLGNIWRRARKDAGINWARFHDLRHFYASYLASNGTRREVIAAILGHKTIVSTARYARFDDDTLKDAVDSFVAKPLPNSKTGAIR